MHNDIFCNPSVSPPDQVKVAGAGSLEKGEVPFLAKMNQEEF
jgi:hypothetical protein